MTALYLDSMELADWEAWRAWFLSGDPRRVTCRPVQAPDPAVSATRWEAREEAGSGATYAVRRLPDQVLVGRVSWFDHNPRNGACEIGFVVAPGWRRRGYAREALELLLEHLFREVGVRKVMAQTAAFNQASRGLLEGVGFCEDGRLREHHELDGVFHDDVLLSLLRREWEVLRGRTG